LLILRSHLFKWSACCGCGFLARWRFCLIQSSPPFRIVAYGSWRTGFQSAQS